MSTEAWERIAGWRHAFDNPVTLVITVAIVVLLVLAPILIFTLKRLGRTDEKLHRELMLRYWSWLVLAPVMLIPILLGPVWTILAVGILSLLCYREFARATGLFRERTVSFVVVVGILFVTFSTLDHWYRLFVAMFPFTVGVITMAAILRDEPKGYIQRVALGIFGFTLFGSCMGHLGYFANDGNYRAILILLLLAVELNDVFAFISGKLFGRRKLIPNTSPKKTVAGAVGAMIATTCLVAGIGHFVFEGTVLSNPIHLVIMGVMTSVLGQFGDLVMSSIKRDLGIKDMAATIPGHGGFLDRFDSILLAAPALFHYIGYFHGIGNGTTINVLTGG